jgi:hypothetical protein
MVIKGVLKHVGKGHWSGDTFCASVIEIGTDSIENVRVARSLLEQMQAGMEMELLICSAHIYGVKVNGYTYKEGAIRQLGWALLIAIPVGWLVVPLILSFVYVRRFYAIYSF